MPNQARCIELMRRNLLDLFAVWGYELVIPPFIEFIDSLLVGTGHDLDLETFKLTDQISGRLMGIRADMTPQVARIDARNLHHQYPTRLCYVGTVLRTRGSELEKSRSPMQLGAELYGHEGVCSDIEIIRLALETLAVAGIPSVHLDLGHVGIYRGLARLANLNPRQEMDLFNILQRKARSDLWQFVDALDVSTALKKMLNALPTLNGDSEVIVRARSVLTEADDAINSAIDDVECVRKRIRDFYPDLPIHFDLAELRGYYYQTGIVFATFIPEYGKEIARGGRYDDIGKIFGRARAATGFSADLKVLTRFSVENQTMPRDAIFAPDHSDPKLADRIRELRCQGRTVIQALAQQQSGAEEMNCCFQLVEKDNDWVIEPA